MIRVSWLFLLAVYLVVFVAVSFAFSIPTPRIRTIGKYSSGPRFGMFKKFQEFFNPPPPEPYIAPYTLDEGEWRSKLSGEEFYVLRQAGTERPWTSPLNDEKREGNFVCKGCGKPLFPHDAKFNSGTGWPSFFKPIDEGSVVERVDKAMGMSRTEVLCQNCGGHLGHVFDDGPRPTRLRYCINGVSLKFIPKGDAGSQNENLKSML